MRCAAILIVAFLVLSGCKSSGESDLDAHNAGTPQQPADNDNNNDGDADTCTVVAEKNEQQARAYYESDVYPVLRGDCLACHVQGGDAANTSFVLSGDVADDYALVKALTEREIAGYPYLLAKATAIAGHTAGVRFNLDSPEADVIRHFSDLLKGKIEEPQKCVDEDDNTGDGDDDVDEEPVEDDFLKGITLLDNRQTLSKAAMIMLGRRPTAEEFEAVADGSMESLRATLRGMMQGPAFTDFLMTGANDQLLTEAFTVDTIYPAFISLGNDFSYYHFKDLDWPGILMPAPVYSVANTYNEALTAEPLALIAYIVNNERDYREVLTADYTVFNSLTYQFFDANRNGYVQLFDPRTGQSVAPPQNPDDWVAGRFAPGVGTGYFLDGSGTRHPAALPYPHTGVLTTRPWLARWPNTSTNGQRKRAKMVMLQFLGYDIELTASRPMDDDALKDQGNPTFTNPACTGCHFQLDPLAGAFQNWGYHGRFRINTTYYLPSRTYPREDALSDAYKLETRKRCGAILGYGGYCDGDLWYADRFPIGFVFEGDNYVTLMPDDGAGRNGPHDDATVRWAASQLVKDPRFATGVVKFWYESVFNEKPLPAPSLDDPEYAARIRAYMAQQSFIADVARTFAQDNGHGAYNLKDLLAALFTSGWFRAAAVTNADDRSEEISSVGMGALLTPEQLERKLQHTLGITWSALTETYNVMYGGIDSETVTTRNRQFNALMANVNKRMVSELACEVIYREFIDDRAPGVPPSQDPLRVRPNDERRLFSQLHVDTLDDDGAIKLVLVDFHRTLWNDGATIDSEEVRYSLELFQQFRKYESEVNQENMRCTGNPYKDVVPVDENMNAVYPPEIIRAWRDMVAYFMSDPRFLSE